MKNIPHLGKSLVVLILVLFISSCSKNDDANPKTDDEIGNTDDDPTTLPNIVALAESVDMLSTLMDAIELADADLVQTLSADGQLTIFAPTNDAFNALLDQLEGFEKLEDFDEEEEKALLAEILKYHVISGTVALSSDLSDGKVLETLQTESLKVNVDGSVFITDKTDDLSEVVSADNNASNGVVHIVDKVLVPQAALDILFPKPSIVEIVVETEQLSLLEEAVLKVGLDEDLNAEGPFTLFAPTDKAIEELFELLGDSFTSFDDFDNFLELQILKQILLYHVVSGNITSNELSPGTVPTLLENENIEVIASNDTFVIGDASDIDANLEEIDKEASNGVVHIIDKILIPQEVQDFLDALNPDDPNTGIPTIKELLEDSDELTFLKEALELTGLLDTLGEEGPYTVFAPTGETINFLFGLLGESFTKLEDFDLDFEIDLLRQVLSYHVVPGVFTANDLVIGDLNTLLNDDTIAVGYVNNAFFLQDALGLNVSFRVTDIPAGNGVIHTINRVMVPQSVIDTIVSRTESTITRILDRLDPEHKELAIAACLLVHESFEDILNTEFTFFLPTNQAFLDLFDQLDGIDSLADFDTEEELKLLGTILTYHYIEGTKAKSTQLTNGQELITYQGEKLNINTNGGIQLIDQTGEPSNVTSPDIEVLSGVIHIVDKVLLPKQALNKLDM
ncbi:fasciclin domain-containing protein [Flagellimonas sp. 389]|uniref:fasciclin domain-containing protein n=1 Tax=Flagellimonas sp. 389 TaxID=2835862 RepID=UPI001BD5DE79|nr:fasciclin domain-containing protein [Flagellimonas sp. 389]MBS9463745.1 fasciclin domain-containing protein [Flagellimonas sp. 389]